MDCNCRDLGRAALAASTAGVLRTRGRSLRWWLRRVFLEPVWRNCERAFGRIAPRAVFEPDKLHTGRAAVLVSLPWVPLVPLLLGGRPLPRRRSLPAAWWALWTYALLLIGGLVLTGYASGLAVAPALAALGVWIVDRSPATKRELERNRRIALSVLAGLRHIVAQIAPTRDVLQPTARSSTDCPQGLR